MGSHFIERQPYEVGFAAVYEGKIRPFLEGTEKRRRIAVMISKALLVGCGVALLLLAWWFTRESGEPVLGFLVFVFGCFLTMQIYRWPARAIESDISSFVGPVLCDFLGNQTFHSWPRSNFVQTYTMASLGILPLYRWETLTDGVDGVWKGVSYRTAEVRLFRKERRSRKEVFHGLLLEIDVPTSLPKIVFLRQHGELSWISETFSGARRGLEKLEFPQSELEQIYTVYTDDVVAAGEHLRPEFGQMLLDISREHMGGRQYLGAAFFEQKMYLALELRQDFLNLGSADTPTNYYPVVARRALADLMIPRRIIDVLHRE